MRITLARVCIFIVAAAFILLCLIPFYHIPPVIPIVLFVIAIILFFVVKRMPADDEKKNMERAGEHNIEAAFLIMMKQPRRIFRISRREEKINKAL